LSIGSVKRLALNAEVFGSWIGHPGFGAQGWQFSGRRLGGNKQSVNQTGIGSIFDRADLEFGDELTRGAFDLFTLLFGELDRDFLLIGW
jgi:hypothetical protein